jgi:fructan beta-fructosidase
MKKLYSTLVALLPILVAYAQTTKPATTATSTPTPVPTPQWRPVYHFTPAKNWTNDPNGLIYINGVYHLYYQHNPFENKWGHMSWGHATSRDLLHWEHLPVAIPEKETKDTTTWIFSGSAVLDANNTSGFGKNAIVAIYTADQPKQKKESQFIAYSNDGGLTYKNYPGNPVIDLHRPDFRDPSVIRIGDKWVMTVAVPDERKVQFYGSADLKKWELLSEFSKQGDTRKIWECPSLTPLFVDGDTTKKKWLLMISSGNAYAGTGMQYFTGDFDGTTFKNDNKTDVQLFVDEGATFYAAIPYNNLPGGKQTMLGWLMPFETATSPWRGQMSIPRDLTLKTTAAGVRLYQQPAEVLNAVLAKLPAAKKIVKKDIVVNGVLPLKGFNTNSYWVDVTITPGTAVRSGISILGGRIYIGYDKERHRLYKTNGRPNFRGRYANSIDFIMPLSGDKIRLQLLFDNSSLEVFVNGGEKVYTTLLFPEKGPAGVSIFAENGDIKIDSLQAWSF